MKLIKYNTFFKAIIESNLESVIIGKFSSKYAPYEKVFDEETKTYINKVVRVYGSKVKGNEYRFHINILDDFIKTFMEHPDITITSKTITSNINPTTTIDYHKSWVLKDYQLKAKEVINSTELDSISRIRLLGLLTGKGKTVTSLLSLTENKGKMVIAILPKYIDKTIGDIKKILVIEDKDIMVCDTSDKILGVISNCNNEKYFKDVKIFIFSLISYDLVIKEYEKLGRKDWKSMYGEYIEDIYDILEITSFFIDEGHEHFHKCYRAMLFTQVNKFLVVTATMISENSFISSLQEKVFLPQIRIEDLDFTKHVTCVNYNYSINPHVLNNIKYKRMYSEDYCHSTFEKSIIRIKSCKNNYLNMILFIIEEFYYKKRKKDDKCLVFVGTNDLGDILLEKIKDIYDGDLKISKYFKSFGGKLIDIQTSDITVTTNGSAGAALDISGLTCVIMTDNKASQRTNLQVLGRLRVIDNRDVYYVWLTANNIKKHTEYNKLRKMLLNKRVKEIKEYDSNIVI